MKMGAQVFTGPVVYLNKRDATPVLTTVRGEASETKLLYRKD
jgi:hypothetical protein